MTNNKLSSMGPVYVINLEHRTDRRNYIDESFKDYGLNNYKFFPAYDGKRLISGEYSMSKGEIGCAMSHLLAIKTWYEGDTESPYLVVMEDDIYLGTVDYWRWDWSEFIDSIEFEYDLIHLSSSGSEVSSPSEYRILPFSKEDVPIYFTTAYLITRAGAKRVLAKYDVDGSIYFDFNDKSNVADWNLIYGSVDHGYKIPLFAANTEFSTDIEGHDEELHTSFQHGVKNHTSEILKDCKKSLKEILTIT